MRGALLAAALVLMVLVAVSFMAWLNPDAAATVMNRVAFCG